MLVTNENAQFLACIIKLGSELGYENWPTGAFLSLGFGRTDHVVLRSCNIVTKNFF